MGIKLMKMAFICWLTQVFSAFEEKVPFLYYEAEEQNNPTQKEKRCSVY
jgi:hypothetical protein